MEDLKISIVIPIYKVESMLRKCLDSVTNQTYQNLEIILIDDGSPDNCGKICDEYAEKDSRVIVIHKTNGGLSDARNMGLQRASGEYIMFVDSDDYIEQTACQKFSEYFKETPDVIIGDCITENKGYSIKHYQNLEIGNIFTGKEYMLKALEAGQFPVVVWLNVYKRSFLNENHLIFKKGRLHEDIEFIPKVFYYAKRVVYSKNKFYYYITNEYSISSAKDKTKHCKDIYETCIELENLVGEKENIKLKKFLNNFLCDCYLGIYRAGKMYCRGLRTHRIYVLKNAYKLKTRMKALLFCISPKWYCEFRK